MDWVSWAVISESAWPLSPSFRARGLPTRPTHAAKLGPVNVQEARVAGRATHTWRKAPAHRSIRGRRGSWRSLVEGRTTKHPFHRRSSRPPIITSPDLLARGLFPRQSRGAGGTREPGTSAPGGYPGGQGFIRHPGQGRKPPPAGSREGLRIERGGGKAGSGTRGTGFHLKTAPGRPEAS